MKKFFGFNDLIIYDKGYWVASNKWNGLYRIDSENENIVCIAEFPDEEKSQENLYMRSGLYKEQIIFAPSCAKKVAIYNILQNEFVMLEIKKGEMADKFHDVIIYDKYAFLICHRYPAILKIDMESYSIEYISGCIDDLQNVSRTSFPGFVFVEKVAEDRLLVPQFISNIVMEFNLRTGAYQFFKVDNIKRSITGIIKSDSSIYLCAGETIYELNDIYQVLREIKIDRIFEDICCHMIYFEKQILLFPVGGISHGKVKCLILNTRQCEDFMTETICRRYCSFSCTRRIEDKIYLFLEQTRTFIIFDLLTGASIEQKIEIVRDDLTLKDEQKIKEEAYDIDLMYMVQELSDREDDFEKRDFNINVGKIIWRKCNESI